MYKYTVLLILSFTCLAFAALNHTKLEPHHFLKLDRDGNLPSCATTEIFQWKKHVRGLANKSTATCVGEGWCDIPTNRQKTKLNTIEVRVVAHLMTSSEGALPDKVGEALVERLLARTNEDYHQYGIVLDVVEIQRHDDSDFYCLPAYSGTNSNWYYGIEDMKAKYAVSPDKYLNIYISCMDRGSSGTLLGIATFPWDEDSLLETGGLWVNSLIATNTYQNLGDQTVPHELGHNFGLFHTFHGVEEVSSCRDPCYERVHAANDAKYDLVGDFCADTLATPLNYDCGNPDGVDCFGTPWGETTWKDIMGYSMDPSPCTDLFTPCQNQRSHCWICNALPTQVGNGGCD